MSLEGEFRLGVLALTDAAPLFVADRLGFFAQAGLKVVLERQGSWATARDRLAAGLLDGAHMLAPVLAAARLGVGGLRADLIAPLTLNTNGAAITLSRPLLERLGGSGPAGATDLARLIATAPPDAPPLTFGHVFPYSLHAYLLRDWLAAVGVDPDRDVRLVALPPTAMTGRIAAGELDGFCVGAPWNAIAQARGLGETIAHAAQLAPDAPDKVFAVQEAWAAQNREALAALLRALRRAATWAETPTNRAELVAILAAPAALDADAMGIARAFEGDPAERLGFGGNGAGRPDPAHARTILRWMQRWRQAEPEVGEEALSGVYRPDLFDEAFN